VCVDVADGQWQAAAAASAAAAGGGHSVSVHLPHLLASRQRQLISVAALTAALLFIYDGLQVCLHQCTNVRTISVSGGQCPLAARGEENFENFTTKWCILKYI